MSEYLTAKQVIDLLHIDRTTLYRMLREERIKGIKVGSQWRFLKTHVDNLIQGKTEEHVPLAESARDIFPIHCIQPIQEVFSDIIQTPTVTVDADGNQLTQISNCCRFCALIQTSESGLKACQNSWKNLTYTEAPNAALNTCHAGLSYSGASILFEGKIAAKIIAGQFFTIPRDENFIESVRTMAEKHGLDETALIQAARDIPVMDGKIRAQLGSWILKIAKAFERIGQERKELMDKLKSIAKISTF